MSICEDAYECGVEETLDKLSRYFVEYPDAITWRGMNGIEAWGGIVMEAIYDKK